MIEILFIAISRAPMSLSITRESSKSQISESRKKWKQICYQQLLRIILIARHYKEVYTGWPPKSLNRRVILEKQISGHWDASSWKCLQDLIRSLISPKCKLFSR